MLFEDVERPTIKIIAAPICEFSGGVCAPWSKVKMSTLTMVTASNSVAVLPRDVR